MASTLWASASGGPTGVAASAASRAVAPRLLALGGQLKAAALLLSSAMVIISTRQSWKSANSPRSKGSTTTVVREEPDLTSQTEPAGGLVKFAEVPFR